MAADKELGAKGEAIAAKYYQQNGYLLLNHNYRTRMGELDLILYKDGGIVFAEVKTRTDTRKAAPAEAVGVHKQRCLIAAAQLYLQRSPYAEAPARFDVVEVTPSEHGWQVHCIRDAFQIS
nr:YraN family protein [uncultured Gemmiger sp.]